MPRVERPREKMILIDQLLHAFHRGIIAGKPHRAAANNLLEGSHGQVIAFLDELTYGAASTPGLADQQAAWRDGVKAVEQVRRGNS